MSLFQDPYLHNSTRTYTALFGTIFNDVKIKRANGKIIKVPLAYASKQKYNVRNEDNASPSTSRTKQQLPRMSFRFTGWDKDEARNTSRYNTIRAPTTAPSINSQHNKVAYKFSFSLGIKTKNLDDMLQIVEMVLAGFNPNINIIVKDNPDLDEDSTITIRLISPQLEDMYEGSFEDEKVLEAELEFELDGWILQPTSTSSVIHTIYINYKDLDTSLLIDSDTIT